MARVHDHLSDMGYRAFIDRNDLVELASLKLAVHSTATFVAFLTPHYFTSAWCRHGRPPRPSCAGGT